MKISDTLVGKCFADALRTFKLAPLTVFCGTNSSGKSTILKIFPLLRQSQGIRENAEEESAKLRFKGTQIDLGNYFTFVSNNDVTRTLKLGLCIKNFMHPNLEEFLKFVKERVKGEFVPSKTENKPMEYELECMFEFVGDGLNVPGVSLTPEIVDPKKAIGALVSATFNISAKGEKLLTWAIERMPTSTQQDKTSALIPNIDEASQKLYKFTLPTSFFETVMTKTMQPQKSEDADSTILVCAIKGLLPSVIIAEPIHDSETVKPPEQEHNWQRWPVPPIIDWQFELFRTALHNLHYVAPIRSPGKRYYIADLDVTPGMDPTGEFLPYILRDKGNQEVLNAFPNKLGQKVRQSLGSALSSWLLYLRTGDFAGIESKQTEFELAAANILVELKVKSVLGEYKHSLADSGFGYSQIVPVLVRGLLTPQDGTLIVEQPELHLHPALQVRIADFFLAMCSIGKQVILETHSEHLVNALRVRIAEDQENKLQSLCKIYFLSTESDRPRTQDLSVQPDGSLDEWPDSFFGEALSLSGRLLRAQKKMREPK